MVVYDDDGDVSGSAWVGYYRLTQVYCGWEGEYMRGKGRRGNVPACAPLLDQSFYARPYAGRV
jgi:hypothetical protein